MLNIEWVMRETILVLYSLVTRWKSYFISSQSQQLTDHILHVHRPRPPDSITTHVRKGF